MRLRIAAEHGVSALKESLLKRLRATELADLWEVCCTCAAASSDDAVSRAQEPGGRRRKRRRNSWPPSWLALPAGGLRMPVAHLRASGTSCIRVRAPAPI
jgi:hypothetical protein